MGTFALLSVFFLRIFLAQGWYIGMLLSLLSILRKHDVQNVDRAVTDPIISRLLSRNLPPQPFPRLPITQIRPVARTR